MKGSQSNAFVPSRAASGRRRWPLLLAVSGALSLSAACASTGGRTAEGALEAFRANPTEGSSRPAERIGRETAEGALAQLSSPAGLTSVATVVDAAVTRSLEAALRAPPGSPGHLTPGSGRSLAEQMAHETALAFGAGLTEELRRALGPDGRGPLTAAIGGAVSEVSRSAIQGARGEVDLLFAGCEGGDRDACVDAKVRSLGRAAAAGFVEGLFGSAAWVVIALAFLSGIAATLLARATLGVRHRHRPQPREART